MLSHVICCCTDCRNAIQSIPRGGDVLGASILFPAGGNGKAYSIEPVPSQCLPGMYSAHVYSVTPQIGRVNNIPTMQFFTGIFRNTLSKSYMLSLAACVWDLQNNALWDAH